MIEVVHFLDDSKGYLRNRISNEAWSEGNMWD